MAERKVLNKYIPPDFDPAKLPRRKAARNSESQQKVRTMLPMSVRCSTCGNYMAKGSKFNVRMELVKNEDYLGMKIFRFYYKCKNCAAEFCMKTDPKSADYIVEAGATRNFEASKAAGREIDELKRKQEEEEKGDAMKALENRTLNSKRELEMFNALDEMKTLRSRHQQVDLDTALRRIREGGDAGGDAGGEGMTLEERLDEEDEAQVRMMLLEQQRVRRVRSDDEDGGSSSGSGSSDDGGGRNDGRGDGDVGDDHHHRRIALDAKPGLQRKHLLAKRVKVLAVRPSAVGKTAKDGGHAEIDGGGHAEIDGGGHAEIDGGGLFGAYGSESDD
jgi:hypothetical protein